MTALSCQRFDPGAPAAARTEDLERLRRYAASFNARDWDALRALFDAETQLEVVSRVQRRGPSAANYFTRYAEVAAREDLRLVVGRVGGAPLIAVYRLPASPHPAYFIQLDWRDGRVERVRDYRYVPYIASDARFTRDDEAPAP